MIDHIIKDNGGFCKCILYRLMYRKYFVPTVDVHCICTYNSVLMTTTIV